MIFVRQAVRTAGVVVAAGWLAAAAAWAQTTSTIVGTVVQPGGGPVPGTVITARQLDTGYARSAVTDADGRYALPNLPVGPYELRAEISGFKPIVRRGVSLTIGERAQVNFTLEEGLALADVAVTVEGRAPLVNTQSPELSYLVSGKALENLHMGAPHAGREESCLKRR